MLGLRLTHLGGDKEQFKALQDRRKEPKMVLANAIDIVTLLYITKRELHGDRQTTVVLFRQPST